MCEKKICVTLAPTTLSERSLTEMDRYSATSTCTSHLPPIPHSQITVSSNWEGVGWGEGSSLIRFLMGSVSRTYLRTIPKVWGVCVWPVKITAIIKQFWETPIECEIYFHGPPWRWITLSGPPPILHIDSIIFVSTYSELIKCTTQIVVMLQMVGYWNCVRCRNLSWLLYEILVRYSGTC
jgi:hypothetical protein